MTFVGLLLPLAVAAVIALVMAALVEPGPWRARLVEASCWAVIAIAVVTGAIEIGQTLIGDTTTVQVPLAVHAPDVLVPGVVIDHIPASEQRYVGSPSLAVLPDGAYVASHDEFGPKSQYDTRPQASVAINFNVLAPPTGVK